MKYLIFAASALTLIANFEPGHAQNFDPGPGAGGAVLKDPLAPAPVRPAPKGDSYVESLLKQPADPTPTPFPNPSMNKLSSLVPDDKPDINQDIQVTKDVGPWMVMVHSYTGPEASLMARQMVTELRAAYKLSAYTFNYGAEERRKEYERVRGVIEKQKEYFAKNGFSPDQPIRVRYMRIEEQVGVLVGGYPSEEGAKRGLVSMRGLKPPDPTKVMLDMKFFIEEDQKKGKKGEMVCVNPFKTAFVARNPLIKQERPADWDKLDINVLRKLNSSESFSLLNCNKPFTLAIKHFATPTIVQPKSGPGAFLENLGIGKSNQRVDAAATSAHNLAELLQKAKLEVYVLHTKFNSIVTVGSFDSLDDPRLATTVNLIETKVFPQIAPLFAGANGPTAGPAVELKAIPMQVPR